VTLDARHSAYLEAVGRDLEAAARRQVLMRRRRRIARRVVALSVTAVILLTGSALAGSTLLGRPAPGFVQATIDSLRAGGDASDLGPVRGVARVVASSDSATLYRSPSRRAGAVCLSIVPAGGPRAGESGGTSCLPRRSHSQWPIGILSRVMGDRHLVFGQVRNAAGASLVLQWRDAEAIWIPIGSDGYFLGAAALADSERGMTSLKGTLRIVDLEGRVIASREVIRLTR
jgi:hypothetical protein